MPLRYQQFLKQNAQFQELITSFILFVSGIQQISKDHRLYDPPELHSNMLAEDTTCVTDHVETKLVLTWKPHPCPLSFTIVAFLCMLGIKSSPCLSPVSHRNERSGKPYLLVQLIYKSFPFVLDGPHFHPSTSRHHCVYFMH